MEIKPVKLYENWFMTQPFAFWWEEWEDKFDKNIKYRSSLQNFLINTWEDVILIDTWMPIETPDIQPDENTKVYMWARIKDYLSALEDLWYQKEQVTKIILTHKHDDHSWELRSFPNATIYVSRTEADIMNLNWDNIVRVDFTDWPYHNFEKSQKIVEGVYMIQAEWHTLWNSIVIAENDWIFYMFQWDVTYTDEALYENKLSSFYEDIQKARKTLDAVREFVKNNPTIYLSTHTPLWYENLENKKIIDLDNKPETMEPQETFVKTESWKYVCSVCWYVYDPEKWDPKNWIPAWTRFEDLPEDWHCPKCRQWKDMFNKA